MKLWRQAYVAVIVRGGSSKGAKDCADHALDSFTKAFLGDRAGKGEG